MSLQPGTEFAGYTVVRKIGAGGMGEVYLVRHPRLPRHDVIKLLAEHVSNDPTFRARFTREADLAAQLDHPCIVSVYDRGEVDGRLWISMQYVPGTDAAALLATSPGDFRWPMSRPWATPSAPHSITRIGAGCSIEMSNRRTSC